MQDLGSGAREDRPAEEPVARLLAERVDAVEPEERLRHLLPLGERGVGTFAFPRLEAGHSGLEGERDPLARGRRQGRVGCGEKRAQGSGGRCRGRLPQVAEKAAGPVLAESLECGIDDPGGIEDRCEAGREGRRLAEDVPEHRCDEVERPRVRPRAGDREKARPLAVVLGRDRDVRRRDGTGDEDAAAPLPGGEEGGEGADDEALDRVPLAGPGAPGDGGVAEPLGERQLVDPRQREGAEVGPPGADARHDGRAPGVTGERDHPEGRRADRLRVEVAAHRQEEVVVRSRRRSHREAVEAVAVEGEDGRHPDSLVGDVGEVGRIGLESELDRLAQEGRAEEEPLDRTDLLLRKTVAEAELAPALGDGWEQRRGRGGLLVPDAEPVEERIGPSGEVRVVRLDRPRSELGANRGVVFRMVPGESGEELEDVAERLPRHRGQRARHRLAVGVEAPAKGGEPLLAEVGAPDRGDALLREEREARVEERREDRPGVDERVVEEEDAVGLAPDPRVGVPREGLQASPQELGRPPVSLAQERLGARDRLERLLGRPEESRDREAVERRELGRSGAGPEARRGLLPAPRRAAAGRPPRRREAGASPSRPSRGGGRRARRSRARGAAAGRRVRDRPWTRRSGTRGSRRGSPRRRGERRAWPRARVAGRRVALLRGRGPLREDRGL